MVQKFTDDALTVCPACEGKLRKVYSAVGIVFQGLRGPGSQMPKVSSAVRAREQQIVI